MFASGGSGWGSTRASRPLWQLHPPEAGLPARPQVFVRSLFRIVVALYSSS